MQITHTCVRNSNDFGIGTVSSKLFLLRQSLVSFFSSEIISLWKQFVHINAQTPIFLSSRLFLTQLAVYLWGMTFRPCQEKSQDTLCNIYKLFFVYNDFLVFLGSRQCILYLMNIQIVFNHLLLMAAISQHLLHMFYL